MSVHSPTVFERLCRLKNTREHRFAFVAQSIITNITDADKHVHFNRQKGPPRHPYAGTLSILFRGILLSTKSNTGITKSRSHYFFLSGSMTNFPGTCNILPNQNQTQHHSPLIKSSHTTFKMPMKLFLQQLLQERNISASQVSIVEDSARFSSHEGFCTSSSSRYHRGEQSSTVSESFSTETSNEQELIAMRRVSYEANQI